MCECSPTHRESKPAASAARAAVAASIVASLIKMFAPNCIALLGSAGTSATNLSSGRLQRQRDERREMAIRYGFMGGHGADSADFARAAEEAGADAIAWGESPTQFPDPYIGMARAAHSTRRARLGTVM